MWEPVCQNRANLETISEHNVTISDVYLLRNLKILLRWTLWILVGVSLVASCAMLVVRYAVLPNINDWRGLIERNLSSSLDLDLKVGSVSANWSGLNPTLNVHGLTVSDTAGKTLLDVPSAFAAVSWRSLLAGGLRLSRLEFDGLTVSATRLADGRLSIAGHVVDPARQERLEIGSDTLAVRWLLDQGTIVSRAMTLRWNDESRKAPELVLTEVEVELSNGLFSHHLAIRANAPPEVGKSFELAVRADHVLHRLGSKANRDAEVYIEMEDVNPQALSAWIDIPEATGRYAARAWIDVQNGRLGQAIVDIAARGIGVPVTGALAQIDPASGAPVVTEAAIAATAAIQAAHDEASSPIAFFADDARIRLTGWLSDILPEARLPMFARSPDAKGVGVTLHASGAQVHSPYFEPNLMPLGRIDLTAEVSRGVGDKLSLDVSRLALNGPSVQISLEGSWHAGGDSDTGIVDLRGTLAQLPVDMLHRYLPNTMPAETRTWLRNALLQGRAADVTFRLQGDLGHFPYNEGGAQGQFLVSGDFHDLSLDYDHGAQAVPGWPMLIAADGKFSIDRMGFSATAQSGALAGPTGERIAIRSLDVGIEDMQLDPRLKVRGTMRGDGDALLSTLRASPAAAQFGAQLNTTNVSGELTIPLDVSVNLAAPGDVAVQGSVRFGGNSVSIGPSIPSVDNIRGTVEFTDKSVRAEDLRVSILGGDARVAGSLGAGGKGLQVDGTLTAAALLGLTDAKDLSMFDGKAAYQLRIRELDIGGFDVLLTSPLVGLSIALPAPLGKTADQRQILSARWVSTRRRNDSRHTLTLSVGDALNLRMERYTGARSGAFFQRAALGIGAPVELPESGMVVEVAVDKLDWDHWNKQLDHIMRMPAAAQTDSDVFPEIRWVHVRAANFILSDVSLTDADLRMTQSQRDQWSATLASKETNATVSWRESSGALAGRVVARVSRLSIGEADSGGGESPSVDNMNESQWSDIPAVDLTIDDFVLYGNRLGALHLQGSNIERGERWNIERLDIHNPHAKLAGSGLWTLKGAGRGVRLKATLDVADLGLLSSYMGYANRVREGTGTLTASVDWRNFPWTFSYDGLDGEARIDFSRGVFEHINSRSARLLELLSIQSLSRLLRLDFRPGNEFQNGFPFTTISGDFAIASGVVSTKNLVVASPIAEVLLVGNSDLSKKVWKMQADVKPIFDMSGAAVATGFAVNPLLGLGALVTQFLLRTPIEHVMTSRYSVTGPWDDPKVEPLDAEVVNSSAQNNPSVSPSNHQPANATQTQPAPAAQTPSPPTPGMSPAQGDPVVNPPSASPAAPNATGAPSAPIAPIAPSAPPASPASPVRAVPSLGG